MTLSPTQQRQAFEKWLLDVYMLEAHWSEERNCYEEFSAHLAYKAWCQSGELATEAAYERAAQVCDKYNSEIFYTFHANEMARQIRALAKKPQASDEGDKP